MSTDNAGLSDYDTPEQRRRARSQTLRSIGAVYGRSRKKTEVDRSETDSECRNCGAPVSARFVAVFGDNDGPTVAFSTVSIARRITNWSTGPPPGWTDER